ncbi:tripartite tricarboxylate transporter substrate-binding protein, partial [Bordetella pertussis]
YGLLAPAGTPAEVVAKLSDAVAAVLDQPAIRAKLEALGVNARATPAADFGRQIDAETEKWRAVIQTAGITLD